MDSQIIDGFPKAIGQPATRAFRAAGYSNYDELVGVPREELAQLHGVGPRALRILDEIFAEQGKSLG
jgi:hypothetical protein